MTDLFFLRPWWLLGVVVCVAVMVLLYRFGNARSNWWELMDEHIARSLVVATGSHKLLTPVNGLLIVMASACIALAGPSFQRQVPDELQGKASVILLVANGDSMYAGDITPNRNRVAKQKIRLLSEAMPGSQLGLITYARSAHQVTPLTDDPEFLQLYLSTLEPKLMPDREQSISGLEDALQLAGEMKAHARYPVNVLLLTDSLNKSDIEQIAAFRKLHQTAFHVLAIGTESGGTLRFVESKDVADQVDTQMVLTHFEALKTMNIAMLGVTQNEQDIEWLTGQITESVAEANNQNPDFNWRDSGYLLTWVMIPACLLLFRKQSWLLSIAPFATSSLLSGLLVLSAGISSPAQAGSWDELWWSADQLGQKAAEQGDYESASQLFEDPYRKGWSLYQLGDYAAAENQFRQVNSHEGFFYLANSLAMQNKYKQSLRFYGEALRMNGDFEAARQNAEQVKRYLAQANKVSANKRQANDQGQIMLQAGTKGKAKKKQHLHLDPLEYSEEELEVWLAKVKSSPEKLLQTKFELQSQRKMIDEK